MHWRPAGREIILVVFGNERIAVNINDVNDAVSRTGTTATEVLALADDLRGHGNELRQQVDEFIDSIRAV